MRTWHRTAAIVGGLLLAVRAGAQPSPESAEALFVRARTLMKSGDCATALPLLEQSHAIEPTVGVRFNMAICEGRLGKLTQALEHLRSVVEASAPNDERRTHAERALRELSQRVPYLVLELDEVRHELVGVRLDGERLSDLRVNEPFAINPGAHEVEVDLKGEPPQIRRFSVTERQVYTWSLGEAAPLTSSPIPTTPDANHSKRPPLAATSAPIWTSQRKVAVVFAGTSVAAFGVATGFALSAKSIYDSSNCTPDDLCNAEDMEKRRRARERGTAASIALSVGVASAFSAATLWLTGAPPTRSRSSGLRVGVHFEGGGSTGGDIVLEGNY